MNPKQNTQRVVAAYAHVSVQCGVSSASPHRLVQMLMEGALDRIATAKGCLERKQIAVKGQQISMAISIVNGLRASLDLDAGQEIAHNLDDLYAYMERRLFEANLRNDSSILDEVTGLIKQIKDAWDAIGDQVNMPALANNAVGA
ncbi:MAG: flagellar export chaperone FliS [Gammaproteobacteria bacterium]|nr:flagellar export chaperone FliS [Gammaproteobacteria bacterium]